MFSISDTIQKSLKLAWEHKIFWVLALLLGTGNFNGNSNNGGGGDYYSEPNDQMEYLQDRELDDLSPAVNGISTFRTLFQGSDSNIVVPFEDLPVTDMDPPESFTGAPLDEKVVIPGQDIEYVPPAPTGIGRPVPPAPNFSKYVPQMIIAAIIFAVFFVFAVGFGLFLRSWVYGALLSGVDDAISERKYTLRNLGDYGRRSIRNMLKYNLFLVLLTLFIILLTMLFIFVSMYTLNNIALRVVFIIVPLVVCVLFIIRLYFIDLIAKRKVALQNAHFKEAYNTGKAKFKSDRSLMFKMAFANFGVALVLGVVFFTVVFAFIFAGVGIFTASREGMITTSTLVLLPLILPAFFALIVAFISFGAYLRVYKTFTWSFLYNHLMNPQLAVVAAAPAQPVDQNGTPKVSDVQVQGGQNG